MIASWMVYTLLVGGLVCVAAAAAERALLLLRFPVRGVWASALALSLLLPCLGHFLPRTVAIPPVIERAVRGGAALVSPRPTLSWPYSATSRPAGVSPGRVVLIGWAVASIALTQLMLYSMAVLYGRRREWKRVMVDGVDMLEAPDFGPAVIGWRRLEIVLPAWAMELASEARTLVVRHEQEHLARKDPRLLIHAALVVLAMPWNPALWWQYRRLRRAIELDCDARVIRGGADVGRYGQVLLEAGGFCRRGGLAALAAFAERASDLEARIKALTPRLARWRRVRVSGAVILAGLMIVAACMVPDPLSPSIAESPPAATTPANLQELRGWARWYLGGRGFSGTLVMIRDADGTLLRTGELPGGQRADPASGELLMRELGPDAIGMIEIIKGQSLQVPRVEGLILISLKPGVQLKPAVTGIWERHGIISGRAGGNQVPITLEWVIRNYGGMQVVLGGVTTSPARRK